MRFNRSHRPARLLAGSLMVLAPFAARADLALSSNDAHTVLNEKNAQVAVLNAPPDSVTVIDLGVFPPRVTGSFDAPGSVVGPPTAVWLAADESWAIVTSATKADPAGPSGISPDDRVSVIDLTAKPPAIVQSLTAGAGATTVRLAPDGKLALIANRAAGTVSIYTVADKRLTPSGTIDFGKGSLPGGMVIATDGRSALVSRYGDNQISLLHIDGTSVTVDPRPLTSAVAPYTMDITPDGKLAVVANMGRGDGDIDSVSFIDLSRTPPRVVATESVGLSPEGIRLSPDGKYLAVALQNGTTRPPGSPFLHSEGRLIMFAVVEGPGLIQMAELPIGRWSQGIAFSRDGKTVLVQNMVERRIDVFRFEDDTLTPSAPIQLPNAGPAAIATPW